MKNRWNKPLLWAYGLSALVWFTFGVFGWPQNVQLPALALTVVLLGVAVQSVAEWGFGAAAEIACFMVLVCAFSAFAGVWFNAFMLTVDLQWLERAGWTVATIFVVGMLFRLGQLLVRPH